jgi:hypothetical protein
VNKEGERLHPVAAIQVTMAIVTIATGRASGYPLFDEGASADQKEQAYIPENIVSFT